MKIDPRLLQESKPLRAILFLSICLGLGAGIVGILQARLVSRVIDQVFLKHQDYGSIIPLLLAIFSYILLRFGFSWAGEASASLAARRIKQALRHRLFTHLLNLGPAFLRGEAGEAQTHTGELVITVTEGLDALELYYSQYLPQIALAALIPLSILLFAFPIDLISGIIFLVTAPLLPLFMYLIGSAAETLTRKQWRGLGRMSAYFLDVLQGLTTLKTFGRSRQQIEVIRKVSGQYREATMRVLRVTFLSALVLELIATLSTAVVAVQIGIRLLYGRMAFEQAFFLLILAPEFYQPLRLLGTRFHAGMAGVEAAKRIFDILDTRDINISHKASTAQPYIRNQFSPPAISFKDVAYTYSNGPAALQGVSFEIPPGKLTALVGESGAGKTTLTWLLMRFLTPQKGQILIDGSPLEDQAVDRWRAQIAWVAQNPYLFNDTVLANIKLAQPDADDLAVREAARQAHADEFIQALPMGYQTPIGERGVRLSAGQAQRIALARAFLKNAPLLILDEATSHLDPEANALIHTSLQVLASGRTVLVIAHHQNTLELADQVVRLSHGKVAEIYQARNKEAPISTHEVTHPLSLIRSIETGSSPADEKVTRNQDTTPQKEPVERRLIKLLSPFIGRIILAVLLGFATIASSIGLMATAAFIISTAALHPSIAELQIAIVGVRFFGLSRGIFRYLERLVSHDMTLRLLANWRTWFYQALEPLAPGRLIEYHSGDLLTRVISDIGSLENFFVRSIAPSLVAVLVGLSTLFMLGSLGMQLAGGLAGFLLLAGIGLPLLAITTARKLGPDIISQRARLSRLLVDGIQGSADILIFSRAHTYTEKVRQVGEKLSRLQARMSVLSALQNSLTTLMANLAMLVVLSLGIHLVNLGQLDGVLLGVVTLTALTCFEALQPLPQAALNYDANRSAASRLYDLADASPLVCDPPEPVLSVANFHLEVHDLSFSYSSVGSEESSPHPVFGLNAIDISLQECKRIAILGPSGAGKTTLVHLLLRFLDYKHGSILLGGHDLHQYRQEDIRKYIATVPQDPYLFSTTIRENLLIARPQASEPEIILAAQRAQLHGFIQSLPDGYNTWIGEHGLRLSAGERQRLSIARALLKDAPLLVLDEPTANLDLNTERTVLSVMDDISRDRSVILITQSMVSLECMDEILVLQDGAIVERGTHDDLLSARKWYCRMWEQYNRLL